MDEKEFQIKKELIEIEHNNKMIQLEFMRETNKIKHEQELGVIRFKSAALKRDREERENSKFAKSYGGYNE